jgi:hypothetical protein
MGLFSWLKPWHIEIKGYCHWREHEIFRKFVLYKNKFVCFDVWELNPEGCIALVEGLSDMEEMFWLRASMIWNGGLCSLLNYTLAFALQLRKIKGNFS